MRNTPPAAAYLALSALLLSCSPGDAPRSHASTHEARKAPLPPGTLEGTLEDWSWPLRWRSALHDGQYGAKRLEMDFSQLGYGMRIDARLEGAGGAPLQGACIAEPQRQVAGGSIENLSVRYDRAEGYRVEINTPVQEYSFILRPRPCG